jgi:hypothetical protein
MEIKSDGNEFISTYILKVTTMQKPQTAVKEITISWTLASHSGDYEEYFWDVTPSCPVKIH